MFGTLRQEKFIVHINVKILKKNFLERCYFFRKTSHKLGGKEDHLFILVITAKEERVFSNSHDSVENARMTNE